ncbi:MAG: hemolysin family protein, partial [Synergistaceae bacterium]
MEFHVTQLILFQIFLILLNAIFACAEIAVISINDNKLATMAAQGDKRAKRLSVLTAQPASFLATIQVAITLSGFLGSAFAADNFSERMVTALIGLGITISPAALDTISVIFITLILSYFTLIFGELVPKRLAMKNAEALALSMSAMIYWISKMFAPLVFALTISTNQVLNLLGIDPDSEDKELSEEEIRMLVDVGSEKGVIAPEEKEMIQNVFEFDDLIVGDFATHRTDIVMLWAEDSNEEWERIISENRFTKYPVCDGTVDNVIGILNTKDYFRLKDKTRESLMRNAIVPAFFIPESICADVLFRQMKQSRKHFAVVLDEYGGMAGIVTMNDLLEQLVGDLENETEAPDDALKIRKQTNDSWVIEGSALLRDVAKNLGVVMPEEEYDIFGGMIFGEYGAIPEDGSEFDAEIGELKIKVTEIR